MCPEAVPGRRRGRRLALVLILAALPPSLLLVWPATARPLAPQPARAAAGPVRPEAHRAARWRLEVLARHPHDPLAHTEGLVAAGDGELFESEGKSYPDGQGGLTYRSSLRRVALSSGFVLMQVDRQDHWAEGLALVGDHLLQLSLGARRASVYDRVTLGRRGDLTYEGEPGWGLCHDGAALWMSDGSAYLGRRDPATLASLGSLRVSLDGAPLEGLNELECADGRIYANLFPAAGGERDQIAVIDPASGAVEALVDASGLLAAEEQAAAAELNGIAALGGGRFAVTGKLWPWLFEVRFPDALVPAATPEATAAPPAPPRPEVLYPEVLATYPHDGSCYTQGLVWDRGRIFESCGLYEQSRLREVDLATGSSIRETRLNPLQFGEGLALVDRRLFQLTWRNGYGRLWGRDDFGDQGSFSYPNEGWGLCYDGRRMVQSDGSGRLAFYSPDDAYRPLGFADILGGGAPTDDLNELECVDGLVWSNVYLTNWIYRIDPGLGQVTGIADLAALVPPLDHIDPGLYPVLNGIAYDAADGSFLVTGKLWPVLYRLRFRPHRPLLLPLLARDH